MAKQKGQKKGTKPPAGKEKSVKTDPVHGKLKKISKAMFTMNNDMCMRTQLNG